MIAKVCIEVLPDIITLLKLSTDLDEILVKRHLSGLLETYLGTYLMMFRVIGAVFKKIINII